MAKKNKSIFGSTYKLATKTLKNQTLKQDGAFIIKSVGVQAPSLLGSAALEGGKGLGKFIVATRAALDNKSKASKRDTKDVLSTKVGIFDYAQKTAAGKYGHGDAIATGIERVVTKATGNDAIDRRFKSLRKDGDKPLAKQLKSELKLILDNFKDIKRKDIATLVHDLRGEDTDKFVEKISKALKKLVGQQPQDQIDAFEALMTGN